MRDARLHDVGVEIVEVQEPLIADDDTAVAIVHDEAVRHVGERVLAALRSARNSASSRARRLTSSQIVIQPPPGSGFSSSDIDEAAGECLFGTERLAGRDLRDPLRIQRVDLVLRKVAARRAVCEHLAVARADMHDVADMSNSDR